MNTKIGKIILGDKESVLILTYSHNCSERHIMCGERHIIVRRTPIDKNVKCYGYYLYSP